ncbi:MAG TPA: hypothetical protein VGK37_11945 [Casimicrobiaceae bacterium]|jgi:hypothetical protein
MNATVRSLPALGAIAALTVLAALASVYPVIAPPTAAAAETPAMTGHDPSGTQGSATPDTQSRGGMTSDVPMQHGGMTSDMPMHHGGTMPDMRGTPGNAAPETMPYHHRMMMEMHGNHTGAMAGVPGMSGQDAFGAIQEIVDGLEADPTTDWSKVDLEALRQHLIDMNEVTLRAEAVATPIDGGLAIAVTGTGRTLAAIQRMVPAHVQEIDGLNHWRARSEPLADGVALKVTSTDAKEVQRIRGLGFIGILVSGSHHRPHHLAIAKGDFPHAHQAR